MVRPLSDAGFEPDLADWDAYRPAEIAARLAGIGTPWYVAGGWAFDLALGGQRRDHLDLEIAIPHDAFDSIQQRFPELDFYTVDGKRAWPLPAFRELAETHHQTWGRDSASGRWRLDVKREPYEGSEWICRLDHDIRLPYSSLIQRTPDGIPYSAPEVILLFKAEWSRAKDDDDFAAVLPAMSVASRRWLRSSLAQVAPGHYWLNALDID